MSGFDIAQEVKAALAEATTETGDGVLIATIKRKGAKTGPDYAPVYGPDTVHTFNALLDTFDWREMEGTAIRSTDTKIMLSAEDIIPTTSDVIEVGGTEYAIYGVTPFKPGGIDLFHEVWARS